MLLIEADARDWNPVLHIPLGVGVIRQKNLFDWAMSLTRNRSFWVGGLK